MRYPKGFLALLMLLCLLGAMIAWAVEGKYVGSSKSHIYHYPDCYWALQIHPENLIHFQSVKEAQEKGYRPCKVCRPPTQD